MAKQSAVSSATETVVAEPEMTKNQEKKTETPWDIFGKANYGVKEIVCQCLPGHPSDEACKTAIIPTAQHVLAHVRAGHGGGFEFTVREVLPQRGKPWKGWDELRDAGAEIAWIRDEVSDKQVDLSAKALKDVLKPHQGKFRGAWQAFNHHLLINIYLPSVNAPATGEYDDEFDNE